MATKPVRCVFGFLLASLLPVGQAMSQVDASGFVFRGDREARFDPVAEAGKYRFRSDAPAEVMPNPGTMNNGSGYRFPPLRERRRIDSAPQPVWTAPPGYPVDGSWMVPPQAPYQQQFIQPQAIPPQLYQPQPQFYQPQPYRPFGHALPVMPTPAAPYGVPHTGVPGWSAPGMSAPGYPATGFPQSYSLPGYSTPGMMPGYPGFGYPGAGSTLPFGSTVPGFGMPGSGFFRGW